MKRIVLLAFALCSLCPVIGAASFEPKDTWPYVYEDFVPGSVLTSEGKLIEDGKYNICLLDGSLHYISEDDRVMKADLKTVHTARLGDDVYRKVWGKMYRLLGENGHGEVLCDTEIDREALDKVNVGYGVSVSSASRHGLSVTALDAGGNVDILNERLKTAEDNKNKGRVLPLIKTTYLYFRNNLVKAGRSDVLDLPGIDKKAAADFIKREKIRWSKTESLLRLMEFIDREYPA